MKMRSCFFFPLVFLLFYSCSNTDTQVQADYFPNSDGNWWEYQYSDTLTLRLELSGVETISGEEVQKLIWNYEDDTNTDYILKKETEIIHYSTTQSWTAFTLVKFPLEEGDSWQAYRVIIMSDTITATAYVEDKKSVSVPAGEFDDCYTIYYENQSLNQPMRIFFAPDVGPIKFEYATGRIEELTGYELE
jgi:hypothetical protein